MAEQLILALVGNIDTGKSSLLNALLGKEVAETSAKGGTSTDNAGFQYQLKDDFQALYIFDTPGISEVGGEARTAKALKAAKEADLVLFVVCGDLNEVEYRTIKRLHDNSKPIILVFNKTDNYNSKQHGEIIQALEKRLHGIVDSQNIIPVSAAPVTKILVQKENGDEELVERKGLPDVNRLKAHIIYFANEEGKHLRDINNFADQFEKKEIEHQKKLNSLKINAEEKSFNFAVTIAIGIGANPVPLLDLGGGVAGIALLIKDLAKLYGQEITTSESGRLAKELWDEGAGLLVGVLLMTGLGSLIKFIPFVGTIAGVTVQGGAAGYLVYVMGLTASEYFANGKQWEHNSSLKATLEKIIASVDRSEITSRITERLKEKLKTT